MKTLLLAHRLLWMNRWLLLLLILWPYAMAAILLLPDGRPAPEDVLSILREECLYSVALVAFSGASLLGNEQRSRRIITVLARAVSRSQYLFALLQAAWIPLILYVVGFSLSACLLAQLAGAPLDAVWKMALLQLTAGLWMACVSIFFSVFLPSILASLASILTAALLVYFDTAGPGGLIASMMKMPLTGAPSIDTAGIATTLAAAGVAFAAASFVFAHRDLNPRAE